MDKLKFIHIAYYCVRTYLNRRVPACEPPKILKIVFLRNFCITKTFLHNAIDKFGFLWYNVCIKSCKQAFAVSPLLHRWCKCIIVSLCKNALASKHFCLWYNTSIISLASKPLWLRHLHYRANALLYHFAKMPLQASIFVCDIIQA